MAAQADAGVLKDITSDIASWKDTINPGALSIYSYKDVQYGVPWDMGMIGVWYNKALFTKAGIAAPPTTWDEFLADVGKLKAAKIVPLAIAGKDKWPSMHLWTYLALRIGGGDNLAQMVQSGDWNTDACTAAGDEVLKLNALDPYQPGYKGADYNAEAAAVGNGEGGDGGHGPVGPVRPAGPEHQQAGASGQTSAGSRSRRSPVAPAPPTDGVGGGNGIAVGKNASPEALDFLKFFSSVENATKVNTNNFGLSPVVGTETRHHRPEPPGRPGGSRAGHLHAALPRPGDIPGHGHGDQRSDDRSLRGRVDPGRGLPGDHGRRGGPVDDPRGVPSVEVTDRERAGACRPARFSRRR